MAAADHFTISGPTVVTDGVAHDYTVTAMEQGLRRHGPTRARSP